MKNLEVRFVHLPPYRVASAHAFGAQPEFKAWETLLTWAEPKGLLEPAREARIFGFDNPVPSPGSPNYGYEFWLTVDESIQPEDPIQIKTFPGGHFAVTRVTGAQNIFNTWKALVTWCENSPYRMVDNQCLEEHISQLDIDKVSEEELTLDLYLPIAEA
jgi:DNA gyrase inhibitor GyrI